LLWKKIKYKIKFCNVNKVVVEMIDEKLYIPNYVPDDVLEEASPAEVPNVA
jgi:hypothetical protein